MDVLLTCAGRRNSLVSAFQAALAGTGKVYAADARSDAPALVEADGAFVLPPVDDPAYVDELVGLCEARGIGLLLSLNDLELPVLAAARSRLAAVGCQAVVSSPHVVEACFDKWATLGLLRGAGLEVPATWTSVDDAVRALADGEVAFPLVVKPRWGTGSLAVEVVRDEEQLRLAHRLTTLRLRSTVIAGPSSAAPDHGVLVQEHLTGVEHGLDVVNDLRGRYRATLARRKLAMRAGETERAVTVVDRRLTELGTRLGRSLGHVGNLDCDVFVSEERCVVLELNPRFGGGYPFSHAAGADVPAALLAWAAGREADPRHLVLRPGVVGAKCDRLVTSTAAARSADGTRGGLGR